MTSSPAELPQPLETISVRDFFMQMNWHGVDLAALGEVGNGVSYETVGQFFATFPWHGESSDPVVPWQEPLDDMPSMGDDALTLESLADLF